MAFALTVVELKVSLERSGCPICDQRPRALKRYLDTFHFESMMDMDSRTQLMEALGFCPAHTFHMVTMEMRDAGDPVGTNLVYEQLTKVARRNLALWQPDTVGFSWWNHLRAAWQRLRGRPLGPLAAARPCPACLAIETHAERALSALVEELQRGAPDIVDLYRQGDGLCLAHLREALMRYSRDYPQGTRFLQQDRLARLAQQEVDLGQYIRKHNWAYRDEVLTEAEERAWRLSLAFFSGYPPDSFQPFALPPSEIE